MRWTRQLSLYALLAVGPLSQNAYAATCYLPSGEVAADDQPCFPQNPVSSCCGGSTYVCSTNNMCAHYSGEYYIIGTCTDKTWNSPACPGYCFFRDHVHNTVFRCKANTYCCADGPTCNCTTGKNTYDIQDFLPAYGQLVGSSVAVNTAVVTSSLFTPRGASHTLTSAPASTTEAASSMVTNSTIQHSITGATTVSETTSTPEPTTPPSSPPENNGLKIGLGVGISLGVVAAALFAVAWVMWRRSKKNNAKVAYVQYTYPPQPQVHPLVEVEGSTAKRMTTQPTHHAFLNIRSRPAAPDFRIYAQQTTYAQPKAEDITKQAVAPIRHGAPQPARNYARVSNTKGAGHFMLTKPAGSNDTIYRCSAENYCCLSLTETQCNCSERNNYPRVPDFMPAYAQLVGSSVSINKAIATEYLLTPPTLTSYTVEPSSTSTREQSSFAVVTVSTPESSTPKPSRATEKPSASEKRPIFTEPSGVGNSTSSDRTSTPPSDMTSTTEAPSTPTEQSKTFRTSPTQTSSTSQTPAPTPSPAEAQPAQSSNTDPIQKAGLGVGMSLGVVGVCLCIAAVIRCRRAKKSATQEESTPEHYTFPPHPQVRPPIQIKSYTTRPKYVTPSRPVCEAA
ncbi:hypothetical protein BDV25DRAFT_135181 [Aspergillus avenaceus]|uniref:Mid2 domain-containing protein n=1 Tax=Aspergillus avenaceus TaxID=36643 RepID=A0A5N6U981_ASPAV|nr:hypothetical protein BDV25DRAFT_135181 [Aspergillus avenaceus]